MPATPVTESFNGGLVTSRHKALLLPGELSRATDTVYRKFATSIDSAPGRTKYNSSAISVTTPGSVVTILPSSDIRTVNGGFARFTDNATDISSDWVTLKTHDGPHSQCAQQNPVTASKSYRTQIGLDTVISTSQIPVLVAQMFDSGGIPAGTTMQFFVARSDGMAAASPIIPVNGYSSTPTDFTINTGDWGAFNGSGFGGLATDANSLTLELTFTSTTTAYWSISSTILTVTSAPITTTQKIKGLAWLSFDGNTDQVIAYAGTALYSSDFTALAGGSFHVVPGISALSNAGTEVLDVIQYGNAYYTVNGVDTPQRLAMHTALAQTVASSTIAGDGISVATTVVAGFVGVKAGQYVTGTGVPASTRVLSVTDSTHIVLDTASTPGTVTLTFLSTPYLHGRVSGLTPVPGWSTGTVVATAGTWNNNPADFGPGFYWFLYTEMVLDGAIDDLNTEFIESGWGSRTKIAGISAKPLFVQIVSNSFVPIVTRNTAIQNSNATHWQVYMGPRTDTQDTMPALELFQRIGSPIVISQTSYTFNEVINIQGPSFGAAVGNSTDAAYDTYDNKNNVLAEDGNFATSHSLGGKGSALEIDFSYSNAGIAPVGFEMTIKANSHSTPLSRLAFSLQRVTSGVVTKATPFRTLTFGIPNTFQSLGGSLDTWAPSTTWVATDVVRTDASNTLRLVVLENWNHTYIDYITLKVYFTGQNINKNGRFLRTITYRSQIGDVVTDSAAMNLSSAPSTGDVFQGKMVFNDTQNESRIVYSLPGYPEYFPIPYQMTFNSRLKDRIRVIRRVGQVLVVGMQSSVKRVNYLPDESDTSFQEGLAHEDLATDHGMVGPLGVAHFDLPNSGTVLAYVAFDGLRVTDGMVTRFLCLDLDWENTVNVNFLSTAVLRNDATNKWLVLYYCPAGASHGKNTRCLRFSYAPSRLKPSPYDPEHMFLPALGPSMVSGRSSAQINLAGLSYIFTGHESDGFIYIEDQGDTLPTGYTDGDATATIAPSVRSRRMYGGGYNRDTREDRFYLLHDSIGDTFNVTSSVVNSSNLTLVSKTNGFTNVVAGMLVTGTNIPPGTIVQTKTDNSNIVLSQAARVSGSQTLTFDDGTIGVTVYGQGIGENGPTTFDTSYSSTRIGDVLVVHNDNTDQGLEFQVDKPADIGNVMKLHTFTIMLAQQGQEQNRA